MGATAADEQQQLQQSWLQWMLLGLQPRHDLAATHGQIVCNACSSMQCNDTMHPVCEHWCSHNNDMAFLDNLANVGWSWRDDIQLEPDTLELPLEPRLVWNPQREEKVFNIKRLNICITVVECMQGISLHCDFVRNVAFWRAHMSTATQVPSFMQLVSSNTGHENNTWLFFSPLAPRFCF